MRVNHATRRPSSHISREFYDFRDNFLFRNSGDDCVLNSFFNGLRLVKGHQFALSARRMELEDRERFRAERGVERRTVHYHSVQKMVKERVKVVSVDHVKDRNGDRVDPCIRFFVDRWRREVFLVVLRGSEHSLHAICIDTRRSPAIIYDCNERRPMTCTADALRACVGEGRKFLGFEDMRIIRPHYVRPEKKVRSRKRKHGEGSARELYNP